MTSVSDSFWHSLVTSASGAPFWTSRVGPHAGLHGALLACFTPGRGNTGVGARLQVLQPSPGQPDAVTHLERQGLGMAFIRGWGERMFREPIIPQKRCETQCFRTDTQRRRSGGMFGAPGYTVTDIYRGSRRLWQSISWEPFSPCLIDLLSPVIK